jgi:2-keto-4-pentenoate hydratase/2-oxohepta-3-ene-1,7-dioic acid hydratase in catechol pathway
LLDAEGRVRDLSRVVTDITPAALAPAALGRLRAAGLARLPVVPGHPRLGCPLADIGKMVCIGLNYTDHAAEVGAAIPREPLLFIKAPSAICGPYDAIIRPRGATKLDYEVELAVVIGRGGRDIAETEAPRRVAGYCIVNDVSEREFQIERGGTTTKGKSADTFGPVGPWLVTADEVPDPQALRLWTSVNGERRQDGHTGTMIFPVGHLVAYVSRFMSLRPGDLISTGTPAGVGHGQKPPRYLEPGDVVEMGISGLGAQRHVVVAAEARGSRSGAGRSRARRTVPSARRRGWAARGSRSPRA